MKFSYLATALVIFILALLVDILFFKSDGGDRTTGATNASFEEIPTPIPLRPEMIPGGDKITLGTSRGSVSLNNFYKIAEGWIGDENNIIIVRVTSEYRISYNTEGSSFGIYVFAGSLDTSRKAAEKDLVSILGVAPEEVCYLNVSLRVSPDLDRNLSGRSYPLSFCAALVQ